MVFTPGGRTGYVLGPDNTLIPVDLSTETAVTGNAATGSVTPYTYTQQARPPTVFRPLGALAVPGR
jgi:hypothetical protein